MTHKLENNYTKEVLALLQNSRIHKFPNLGIWQRTWEPPGNLTLESSEIWLQNFYRTGWGSRLLEGTKETLCTPGLGRKEQWPPQETDSDLPVSVQESLVEAWVDNGLPRGQWQWIQESWHKYDPAIPLLGIHTEETRSERDTCTPVFIAALFIIARTWKQPRCPSADKWIRKLWYIYTMKYYSAIKNNSFESVLMRWMKLEPIIQSEVSQKDKDHYSILTHIYGI